MAVFDFQKTEQKVLQFWRDHHIFQKSLDQRRKGRKKDFVFFEGPPTANGRPGIHHFIGRAFKDLFNRYKTMQGYFVLRKAGWDTHGLPVELEVEKQLGFTNKKQIEEYGVAAFNRKARESVWKYQREWEEMTERMGFWVDMTDPYITYESPYVESLWNVMRQVWDKKLLYKAHRVVPYCTRCGTALSSHEVAQGYKTVNDTSVYLKFKVISEGEFKGASILAWTTTPWTLPGNVALAVGKNILYVVAIQGNDHFIVAKELAPKILGDTFTVGQEVKGSELVGLQYEPLFDVPALQSEKSYHVYLADFVSTTDGTGVVHTAVMYGEDDYVLGTALRLPKVHSVDKSGKFTGVGKELDGLYVKDPKTEAAILAKLKGEGKLLKTELYEHEYPFCWRCDTPLLYYAKDSWFIQMSALRDQMLGNNATVNWIPAHIKEGRFGQWLREGKDWAFSRERYWGTPLPIWECGQCGAMDLVGSYAQLREHAVSRGNTYFVMRHGFTMRDEREKGIISTRLETDVYPLTDEGRQKVETIVTELKRRHDHFDYIYASPFQRTKETAEIAARTYHTDVIFDERLGELRHSLACEGQPHTACPMADQKKSFTMKDEGGESWDDVRSRMMAFMQELEQKHKGKKILIVSHGHPMWLLDKIAEGLTAKEILARKDVADWYPPVAGVKQLNWQTIPRNELGELDPHRPFIDEVALHCQSCNADMHRIPDLVDVWFDSGAMPYAQWHWPFENEKTFREQFPADFITEAIDQTRGWFYTLLAVSTLLGKGAPYKNVLCYSHVLDEKGQKMSKSKGNIVLPGEVMDKFGVDTARWFFYTINSPGDPKLYAEKDVRERLTGFIATLANCMRFYELYKEQAVGADREPQSHALDQWILSRLHNTVQAATAALDAYDPTTASRAIEKFVTDDFSNWWLRRSRKRPESLPLLRILLLEIAKLCAPFIPFTAEDMYLRLRGVTDSESVHLADWPAISKRSISAKLEEEMQRVQEAVRAGLALRKELQIRVRQPLQAVTVTGKKFVPDLEALIKDELNVKEVRYQKAGDVMLELALTPELVAEGLAREMIRQIQDMRKEAGYAFDAKVYCQWHSGNQEVTEAINHWSKDIERQAVLSDMVSVAYDNKVYDVQKETELVPGKKIWIGLRK